METEKHPAPALPLLALLAFASALGIAVAIVLAGVAMLLAAPAYADEGKMPDASPLLERRSGLAPAKLLYAQTESHRDGQGATLVERTAEIAPGETLRVELEYRSRSPRRVLALR